MYVYIYIYIYIIYIYISAWGRGRRGKKEAYHMKVIFHKISLRVTPYRNSNQEIFFELVVLHLRSKSLENTCEGNHFSKSCRL